MQHRLVVVLGVCSVLGWAAACRATTLEEATKELVKAHARLKSYRASIKSTEDLDFGDGTTLKATVTGMVEWLRAGDKMLFRADSKSRSIQTFNGVSTPTHSERTMIYDGEFFYTLANIMGEVQAAKDNPKPLLGATAEVILDALKDDYKLALLDDETWGGAACYVIEATPKTPGDTPHMVRTRYYFRKDTGTAVRTLGFDAKSNVAFSMDHHDVERNPVVDPERFKFTLPDGVRMVDYVNP